VLDVRVHGALGNDQPPGDLPVGQSLGHQPGDLPLAAGEPGGRRGGRPGGRRGGRRLLVRMRRRIAAASAVRPTRPAGSSGSLDPGGSPGIGRSPQYVP
jgi:hypothetical protein